MKVAVIGSRNLHVGDLGKYLPDDVTEIVSGGAKGIDTDARIYALQRGIKLTEILPEYDKYGRSAPLRRNITIIEHADEEKESLYSVLNYQKALSLSKIVSPYIDTACVINPEELQTYEDCLKFISKIQGDVIVLKKRNSFIVETVFIVNILSISAV